MANGDKKFSTRLKEEKKIPKKVEKGFSASENPRAGSNSSKIRMENVAKVAMGHAISPGLFPKGIPRKNLKPLKKLPIMNPLGIFGKLFEE